MNHSWTNTSNNAAGFIYFNTNNLYHNPETTDFLSFNTSYGSPECNKFSPVSYSSPNKFQKSPRNFCGRQGGRNNFRYHNSRDNSSFNNSNRSFNSPNFSRNHSFNNSSTSDVSHYWDHTITKNPWAELELELKKKQEAEGKVEPSNDCVKDTAIQESPSCSADEQENESVTNSSSSKPEKETT